MSEEAPALDESLSSVLKWSVWTTKGGFRSFAILWAAFVLPFDLLVAWIQWSLPASQATIIATRFIPFASRTILGWLLIAAVGVILAGDASPAPGAVRLMLRRGPALVWTWLVLALRLLPVVFAAGFIGALTVKIHIAVPIAAAAIAVAIVLWFLFRWTLITCVVFFDFASGGAALRDSARLSGRRFGSFTAQYCGIMLIVIAAALLTGVVAAGIVLAGAPEWFAELVVGPADLLIAPFGAATYVALYRRESAADAAAV